MKTHPVFVRSLGAVSGLGNSWSETWRELLAGSVRLTTLAESGFRTSIPVAVSAVPGLNRRLEGSNVVQGAAARLACASLTECLASGFSLDDPITLYGGTNHGETDIVLTLASPPTPERSATERAKWGGVVNDPLASIPATMLEWRLRSGTWGYSACTSSLHALANAVMDLQDGDQTDAVVLGVDAMSLLCVAGFVRAGAAARRGCSPLREGRSGLLIGEGAAALGLSVRPADHNSEIEVLGLAMTCDAGHPTQPDPSGKQLERALRESLKRAGLTPADVHAVICHGTGTVANDIVEAKTLGRVWRAASVPVTSIKASIGHCMGASGLFNCLAAVEICRTGWLPPTVGNGSEPLRDIDVVTEVRRIAPGGPVITLASGFGGNHVAVVLGSR